MLFIPAAFGRLCVETLTFWLVTNCPKPAAFGRLCVETVSFLNLNSSSDQPPSGGCVLKPPFQLK